MSYRVALYLNMSQMHHQGIANGVLRYARDTSIPFDRHEIGFRAAERLDALMRGLIDAMPPLLITPMPVVERASSALASPGDELVGAALAYIRREATRGISAVDVARRATCSRRTLESRFQSGLGHSILAKIHRVRVNHARHLLMETSLPVSRVSSESGFNSVARFITVFTALTGESPKQCRKRKGIML